MANKPLKPNLSKLSTIKLMETLAYRYLMPNSATVKVHGRSACVTSGTLKACRKAAYRMSKVDTKESFTVYSKGIYYATYRAGVMLARKVRATTEHIRDSVANKVHGRLRDTGVKLRSFNTILKSEKILTALNKKAYNSYKALKAKFDQRLTSNRRSFAGNRF